MPQDVPQVDGERREEKPGGQGGTWGGKENNTSPRSLADFPGVEDGSGRKRICFVVENVSVLLLLPLLSSSSSPSFTQPSRREEDQRQYVTSNQNSGLALSVAPSFPTSVPS